MPLTSIIVTAYDFNQTLRNITLQAMESIIKYTDEGEYEIVFIDTIPTGARGLRWWDGYKILQMGERDDRRWYKFYEDEEGDPGQYACYNKGVEHAKGELLCFYQNDVFVPEGWLTNMRWYIDHGYDVVMPDQYPRTRAEVKEAYGLEFDSEEAKKGTRDAGLFLMTRDAYKKLGGWNEKIMNNYGEKDLFDGFGEHNLKHVCTKKVMVLHVKHAVGWIKDREKYEKDKTTSSQIIQKPYKERR